MRIYAASCRDSIILVNMRMQGLRHASGGGLRHASGFPTKAPRMVCRNKVRGQLRSCRLDASPNEFGYHKFGADARMC